MQLRGLRVSNRGGAQQGGIGMMGIAPGFCAQFPTVCGTKQRKQAFKRSALLLLLEPAVRPSFQDSAIFFEFEVVVVVVVVIVRVFLLLVFFVFEPLRPGFHGSDFIPTPAFRSHLF